MAAAAVTGQVQESGGVGGGLGAVAAGAGEGGDAGPANTGAAGWLQHVQRELAELAPEKLTQPGGLAGSFQGVLTQPAGVAGNLQGAAEPGTGGGKRQGAAAGVQPAAGPRGMGVLVTRQRAKRWGAQLVRMLEAWAKQGVGDEKRGAAAGGQAGAPAAAAAGPVAKVAEGPAGAEDGMGVGVGLTAGMDGAEGAAPAPAMAKGAAGAAEGGEGVGSVGARLVALVLERLGAGVERAVKEHERAWEAAHVARPVYGVAYQVCVACVLFVMFVMAMCKPGIEHVWKYPHAVYKP